MSSDADSLPAGVTRDRLAALARSVPTGGERPSIEVRAPFTDDRLGSVPACTDADVAAAVERADEAQTPWADRSVASRAEVLRRFHDLVLTRRDDLLDLTQAESGKARVDAFQELTDVATNARYYAARADDYLAPTRRTGAIPLATRTTEHRHPKGVVGIVAPWNYPLTLAVSDAIPALLAGNAVVCKPASETPFTALAVRDLLREAGVPEGVFQIVTGRGSEAGAALVGEVDYVCFTGSTETGREVAARAGERLVGCSLELGGKNPMVVLPDADVEAAARGAVTAAFTNAGQLCISIERIYVHERVHDEFLDALVRATRACTLGTGYGWGIDVGSLVSARQLATVREHVDDAVEQGANVLTGGRARPDLGPYVFEPTVLTGVTGEMALASEETFGPVVAVHAVETVEEAVTRANDSDYGLNASVWTGDGARGRDLATRIECGTVNVNDAFVAAWGSVDAPMGGMKDSGLGRRHGREGFQKYTESQTVAEQRVGSFDPPDGVPTAWFADAVTWSLRAAGTLSRAVERLTGGRR